MESNLKRIADHTLSCDHPMKINVPIFHIPHSSLTIRPEYRDRYLIDDDTLAAELLRMTDHFTEELFSNACGIPLVFSVSRLLVDVERFEDDALEAMSEKGRGVLYTRTHDQKPLREPPTAEGREALLEHTTTIPTIVS